MDYPVESIASVQRQGTKAARAGAKAQANPYVEGTDRHVAWGMGHAFGLVVMCTEREGGQ